MPTLRVTDARQRFPAPVGPTSSSGSSAVGNEVRSTLASVSGGNTVDDQLTALVGRPFYRGMWEDLPGSATINVGDIMGHSDSYYICKVQHTKLGFGPDTDTDNFDLLNNWRGDWNTDAYYHEATMVRFNNNVWITTADVLPSDGGPGVSNHWLQLSGANPAYWAEAANTDPIPRDKLPESERTSEHDSPTISHEDNKAYLEDPGTLGVWSGPSLIPRGADSQASLIFGNTRPSGQNTRLTLVSLPVALHQYLTRYAIGASFGDTIPDGITMSYEATFTDELPASATNVKLNFRRIHKGSIHGDRLGTEVVVVPPNGTSNNNPHIVSGDIDLSGIDFTANDQLYIDYGQTGTAGDAAITGILESVHWLINIEGVATAPSAYDTFPVQSRPIRDVRSVDRTSATKENYTTTDLPITNVTETPHAVIRSAVGEDTGNGWRIDNTKSRGQESNTTDIVVTAPNTTLGFSYSGYVTFTDRDNDPGRPDQLRIEIMSEPAAGTASNFEHWTSLAHADAADLIAYTGSFASNVINATTHVITDWTISEGIRPAFLSYLNGAGSGTMRGIQLDQNSARRIRLGVSGSVTADPGELSFRLYRLDSDGNTISPSEGNGWWNRTYAIKDNWSHGNPTQGSPSTFDLDAIYDSDRDTTIGHNTYGPHGRWGIRLFRNSGTDAIDISVLNIQLDVEWWGDSDDARQVDISATGTFQTNDKIAIRARNSTTTTERRDITLTNQSMKVWNVDDISGRNLTMTGTVGTDGKLNLTTESTNNSEWWVLSNTTGTPHSRRDARGFSGTLTVPARDQIVEAKVYRKGPGLASRELVKSFVFPAASAGTQAFAFAGNALVADEELQVDFDNQFSGTVTLSVEAETIGGVPAVQTKTAGLLRNRKICDGTLTAGASAGFAIWRRIPLYTGVTWGEAGTFRFMLESATAGKWDTFTVSPEMLQEISTLETTRLGERVNTAANGDDWILFRLNQRALNLFIAPLEDGGMAVARGDATGRNIKGFLE